MTSGIVIRQLRIGSLTNLANTDTLTGIHKQETESAHLGFNGLSNDQQGDRNHHGGPEKALHHFASDHYARLRRELPEPAAGHCQPGAFGENLVTSGFSETDVCVGDIFVLGEAIVQVDRKSTGLNSSHVRTSYAALCLKKTMIKPDALP